MLDDLDRSLVHALQVSGRAPFGVIAAALGVSDRTVARRYTRLRGRGILRVVGVPDDRRLGRTEWFIRLRCVPDGSLPIAHALARRDDISWIMLTSAGTEITCMASTRSTDQRDALLLGTIPRSRRVAQVDALCVLHVFFGGPTGWNRRGDALTAEQVSRIAATATRPGSDDTGADALDAQDERLIAELRLDGRRPVTELAATLGCSETAAARRLDRLLASGALYFDVEIPPKHLGYGLEALLWVTVAPAALEDVGTTAAAHPQVALAAARSGSANLLLVVGCRDTQDLYRYLARDLGPLPGVQGIETAPIIRNVKRAGALLEPTLGT